LTVAGYFSVNHTLMGPKQDLFGQLWKEYSLSDSRYLTSDPFVLCMETITAVCLPFLPLLFAANPPRSSSGAPSASSSPDSSQPRTPCATPSRSSFRPARFTAAFCTMPPACSTTTIRASCTAAPSSCTFGATTSS
jgi:hypothetical protein